MVFRKKKADRGRIELINLKKAINFNGSKISRAKIEIDHINYGLDKVTHGLNKKPRTNFTVRDVEQFIMLLDGEILMPKKYKGKVSEFAIRLDCPVRGKFFGKEFIMIFDTDYEEEDLIYTITLIPGW